MPSNELPSVCQKCGSPAVSVAHPVTRLYGCESRSWITQGEPPSLVIVFSQSNRCQITCLKRDLAAAQAKLAEIEDQLTATNSHKIDCDIIWNILHPKAST